MPRTSPQSVFIEAQTAIAHADWEAFFACLDRNDLLRVAENSLNFLLNHYGKNITALTSLCTEYSFPSETFEDLQRRATEITESAQSMLDGRRSPASSSTQADALRQHSLKHQQLVKDYDKRLKNTLKSVPNPSEFTAALERQMRATVGQGSVSSRLFLNETLQDVVVTGKKAWATRRDTQNRTENIGFVEKKGIWYIKLFARRPKQNK